MLVRFAEISHEWGHGRTDLSSFPLEKTLTLQLVSIDRCGWCTLDVVLLRILWVLDMLRLVSVTGTFHPKVGGQEKRQHFDIKGR